MLLVSYDLIDYEYNPFSIFLELYEISNFKINIFEISNFNNNSFWNIKFKDYFFLINKLQIEKIKSDKI